MSNSTDHKFFTNAEGDTLLDRFCKTLKDTKYFDVVVGYFRTSGFYRLYSELETAEKIRILIGLNVDKKSVELIEESQSEIDFYSHTECREDYCNELAYEMEHSEDTINVEVGAQKFIEFIQSGKLEIKVHPSRNIHAKVYITRYKDDDRDTGNVITGSSNFSQRGLDSQREFNVQLKDKVDVDFACEWFEKLWKDGIDVSKQYIETLGKSWPMIKVTPYEVYLKFLYEYFKEDLEAEKFDLDLPRGFLNLEYQREAVFSARRKLESYNGVFLSDVVGLGKTFITSLFLKSLPGKNKLIICPPALIDYWRDTLQDFHVSGHRVESLGSLEKLLKGDTDKYDYIVIDEVHRFRNEMTQGYENLHKICLNKKIILVSATPLNNYLDDIKAQIKLFQPLKNSTIPGVPNIDDFFKDRQKEIDKHKEPFARADANKRAAEILRDRILKHIMVRRTRSEITKHFPDDISKQKLHFPKMDDPERIVYQFSGDIEEAFNATIKLLKQFSYARYTPLKYHKNPSDKDKRRLQSQLNLGGFMKGILVKRLESSFYAFKKTVNRFIASHKQFIEMFDKGDVWISKSVNVYELLEADDEDRLWELWKIDKAQRYESRDFKPKYREKVMEDIETLEKIQELWADLDDDPKLDEFVRQLETNAILKGKKILVFSESKETVSYLQRKINENKNFKGKVLSYSSSGGDYDGDFHKRASLKYIIQANYDPNHVEEQDDNVQILLTTDVLAEGVNLHRANIIVNYDLPWNPARVLQRVGRVNRVGTEHKQIYVFNIFPTTQSDKQLGLEGNITRKIKIFHETLGEDAKYISSEEEVTAHELFDNLTKKPSDEEGGGDPELKYREIIFNLRDKNKKLFNRIVDLPKKIRVARKPDADNQHDQDRLLTFFRKNYLKEFVITGDENPEQQSFLQAAKMFKCDENTPSVDMPKNYYELLADNKNRLKELLGEVESDEDSGGNRGQTNEDYILKTIKAVHGKSDLYTQEDNDYLLKIMEVIQDGVMPRYTIQRIKRELTNNKLKYDEILQVLRLNVDKRYLDIISHKSEQQESKEIILNEFFLGKK